MADKKERVLERPDPQEAAKSFAIEVFQKELHDIGQRIIADAGQWGRIDDNDLEQLPETMIDISLAQFELWLVGER